MLKHLLWPFALLYGFAVKLRNALFNVGVLKSTFFSRTICVGNLTVGGTGKTPHTEYLINLIKPHTSVALLSRGYKRKSKGFVLANQNSSASAIGDEPYQIFSKFPNIAVAVDGDRVNGIETLRRIKPEIDIIVLDDAFQHRYAKAEVNILLTDYSNLIHSDFFLPVGKLRDSFTERKRANMVVVTKCPTTLAEAKQQEIRRNLKLQPHQMLFFSTLTYGSIKPVFPEVHSDNATLSKSLNTLAVAGIANPKPFFDYLANESTLSQSISLPDHFNFSEKKIRAIFERFLQIREDSKVIVTTEKDASRLREFSHLPSQIKMCFYYLPIEVTFLDESKNEFNNKIQEYVRNTKANNGLH